LISNMRPEILEMYITRCHIITITDWPYYPI